MRLNNDIIYNYGYIRHRLYSSYDKHLNLSVLEKELKKDIEEAKYGYFKEDNEFNSMYMSLIKRYQNEKTFPTSMLWHIKDHVTKDELTFCVDSIKNSRNVCKQYLPNNEEVNILVP